MKHNFQPGNTAHPDRDGTPTEKAAQRTSKKFIQAQELLTHAMKKQHGGHVNQAFSLKSTLNSNPSPQATSVNTSTSNHGTTGGGALEGSSSIMPKSMFKKMYNPKNIKQVMQR